MKASAKIAAGIIILMLFPFFVQAQILDPIHFGVKQAPEKVKAGAEFHLTVKATIKDGWHLYSVHNDPEAGPYPTKFSAGNDAIKITGPIRESTPKKAFDPNFKAELAWHEDNATFTIPVAFFKGAGGATKADVKVLYQVCNDKVCLPPKTGHIVQVITVDGVAADTAQSYTPPTTSSGSNSGPVPQQEVVTKTTKSSLGGDGFFAFIWVALAAGFAALLTPCVYPMIPLTVSFFSKQEERNSSRAGISAFGFGLAIVAIFTILGVLLSLFIGVAGANRFAANPWVNLFIAAVLVVFALSLLGAFEIRLPYQLTNWLNKRSDENAGVAGILFIALTISAVSFSCTVPFVGGVLAATTGGQWFYPIVGMICFSAAFASPFVLLALFPSWLESLPKSGAWMNVIKVILGFIELAAAFKFLSNADLVWDWGLISRPFIIAAWIAIFLLTGLYVLGVFAIHHQPKPKTIGTGRMLLALPFFLFSFYLIPGLMGASMGIWDAWLPPKKATDISVVSSISQGVPRGNSAANAATWSGDFEASIKQAKQAGKPVFIDFTGYTCTNCRAMETNVFSRPAVRRLFGKMKLVRLYTDDGTDGLMNQKFQFKLTGTVALPTYVMLDPNTRTIINQLEGYTKKQDFQKFLNRGLGLFKQQKATI